MALDLMGRSVPERAGRPVRHQWGLVRSGEPAAGAVNMALDEALFEAVRQGAAPTLRFYTWSPACLSLGRNQAARGVYDPVRAAAAGVDVVRRPTGGLAVLHDCELTYSVIAPIAIFGGPKAAYAAINRALVEGLRSMGIPAVQAVGAVMRGPVAEAAEPCFQAPATGEVTARDRKLVGSAQRCERGCLLQHGSVLLSGSQARVRTFLMDEVTGGGPDGSITIEELTGSVPPVTDLESALVAGFEQTFGTRLAPRTFDRELTGRVHELTRHYESDQWTWRR